MVHLCSLKLSSLAKEQVLLLAVLVLLLAGLVLLLAGLVPRLAEVHTFYPRFLVEVREKMELRVGPDCSLVHSPIFRKTWTTMPALHSLLFNFLLPIFFSSLHFVAFISYWFH